MNMGSRVNRYLKTKYCLNTDIYEKNENGFMEKVGDKEKIHTMDMIFIEKSPIFKKLAVLRRVHKILFINSFIKKSN